jgi:hypothetical protein
MSSSKFYLYLVDVILSIIICVCTVLLGWWGVSNAEYQSLTGSFWIVLLYFPIVLFGAFGLAFVFAANKGESRERIAIYAATANIFIGIISLISLMPLTKTTEWLLLISSQIATLIGLIIYVKIFKS